MAKFNRKLQVTVRPQKRPNLPKAAVNILTRWLEENCTNPYPSESTKKILMEVTNLTKNQVSTQYNLYTYIIYKLYFFNTIIILNNNDVFKKCPNRIDLQLVHK